MTHLCLCLSYHLYWSKLPQVSSPMPPKSGEELRSSLQQEAHSPMRKWSRATTLEWAYKQILQSQMNLGMTADPAGYNPKKDF